MKYFIIITIFFLTMAFPAFGQESGSSPVEFGIRGGMNVTSLNFFNFPAGEDFPTESSWNGGVGVGVVMIVPLSERFFIQPEYLYNQVGGEVKQMNISYRFNYFSLPVLLRWQAFKKTSLLAGPQFDLLIDASQNVGEEEKDITKDVENRGIGLMLGLEYEFWDSLAVGARYLYGINHVGLPPDSELQEFKKEMLQVSAIYKFTL